MYFVLNRTNVHNVGVLTVWCIKGFLWYRTLHFQHSLNVIMCKLKNIFHIDYKKCIIVGLNSI